MQMRFVWLLNHREIHDSKKTINMSKDFLSFSENPNMFMYRIRSIWFMLHTLFFLRNHADKAKKVMQKHLTGYRCILNKSIQGMLHVYKSYCKSRHVRVCFYCRWFICCMLFDSNIQILFEKVFKFLILWI